MAHVFRTYKEFLQERFPKCKSVRKVTLDAGCTCPNLDGTKGTGGCIYCDNRSFSPALALRGQSITTQIEQQAKRIHAKYPGAGLLAYFQPFSNTYAPLERLSQAWQEALNRPEVVGLSIGTRPDCLPNPILELLRTTSRIKPLILEIGLQTANDTTLNLIHRGHTVAEFTSAMNHCLALIEEEHQHGFSGFDLATHLILGLPGETSEDFLRTGRYVAQYPLCAIKIHPLHVIRGTALAKSWKDGDISLLSFEAYCQAVAMVMRELPPAIAIERFSGEAPSESLLAPDWCGDRNAIVKRVMEILNEPSKS
ncbi:MAG TPA: TIGR01212 family radical SAM protein [Fibrobacteraceae bacterium]|nr:TIGR01212 family radical SAM protein [Fibrobacteraceae bacterium]